MLAAVAVCALLPGPLLRAAPTDKPATKPKAPANRPQIVQDAIKKFEGGDENGAYEMLKTASKEHANLPPPLMMLANLYFTSNQPQKGLVALEKAAKDHPTDPEPHLLFGELALRGSRVSDAEAQLMRAGELLAKFDGDKDRKSDFQARYFSGLAAVAEVRGNWENAQKYLQSLLKVQPQNASAHHRLGAVLYRMGKPDEEVYKELIATVDADKADKTKTDPKKTYPPAALLMADIVQKAGKKPDAKADSTAADDEPSDDSASDDTRKAEVEKWLKKAITESPKDARPLSAMANWLFGQEELEQADSYAQKAKELDPKSQEVQALCGLIARYRKDYAKAESYFGPIVQQEPTNVPISNQLALVLAEQKDSAKLNRALALAEVNVRAAPKDPETAATYGWILYKLNRFEEAKKVMGVAMQSSQISRDTAYYVARLLSRLKDTEGSQKMLRKALESNGPFANLADARQWQTDLDKKRK